MDRNKSIIAIACFGIATSLIVGSVQANDYVFKTVKANLDDNVHNGWNLLIKLRGNNAYNVSALYRVCLVQNDFKLVVAHHHKSSAIDATLDTKGLLAEDCAEFLVGTTDNTSVWIRPFDNEKISVDVKYKFLHGFR